MPSCAAARQEVVGGGGGVTEDDEVSVFFLPSPPARFSSRSFFTATPGEALVPCASALPGAWAHGACSPGARAPGASSLLWELGGGVAAAAAERGESLGPFWRK